MPLGSVNLNLHTGGRRMSRDSFLSGNATVSTTQAKFGSSSLYLNGNTTDRQTFGSIPMSGPAGGPPKYPNITIEFWYYKVQNSSVSYILFDCVAVGTGWEFVPSSNGSLAIRTQDFSTGTGVTKSISSGGLALNTWHHVASVRSGDTWGFWTNGTSHGTFTNTDFRESNTVRALSSQTGSPAALTYIDEFRISYVSRYTPGVDFTPPTAPFVNDLDTVCLFHYEDGIKDDNL